MKLYIDNSYSQLTGLTTEQFSEIRKILSYEVDKQQAYFSGSYKTRRYLIDKKGCFPTGLLYYVRDWALNSGLYPIDVINKRSRPTNRVDIDCRLQHEPYEDQNRAVEYACEMERGTISMVTGYGKSVVIARLIDSFKLKTLVIVPNLQLKHQLKTSFKQWFGANDNITVENIDNPSLFKMTDYDVLIIDESHHVAAKTYRLLNKKAWNKIYYRFFLTATPFRSKDEEQMLMEGISGQVFFEVGYHSAVAQDAIVPVEAYYVELPKTPNGLRTWPEVYNKLVVNNSARNHIIAEMLKNLKDQGKSTLCLVKEIAHGKKLSELTGIPFACGEDENSIELIANFNSKASGSLIATTGVCGEGVDTKPAEFIVIAGLGRSRNALAQQIGRGLRKYPGKTSAKIIIFKDKSHKHTLTHFKDQYKLIKERYGVEPIELK